MGKYQIELRPRMAVLAEKQKKKEWRCFKKDTFSHLMWHFKRVLEAENCPYRHIKLSKLYDHCIEEHLEAFCRYSKYSVMNNVIILRALHGESLTLKNLYFTVKYPNKSVFLFTYATKVSERCDIIQIPKSLRNNKSFPKKISHVLQETLSPESMNMYEDVNMKKKDILRRIGNMARGSINLVTPEEDQLYGAKGTITNILRNFDSDESDNESGDESSDDDQLYGTKGTITNILSDFDSDESDDESSASSHEENN